MKTKCRGFFFTVILLVGVFQLAGCQSPNKASVFKKTALTEMATPVISDSWQTISNRWGSVPLEKIKQAAGTNEVTAQYYLAIEYSNGDGVSKEEVEAFKWMKPVAERGMARAQRKLGWMLQNGLGVATNLEEAVAWYRKAAEQGDAPAQMNLGWMFENGVSVFQDYTEAARFYRLAAEQGHAMAQNNLGWLYKKGWGVPQDAAEAVKWFQKSADQGEVLGEENLAWTYAEGAYGAGVVNGQGADAQIRSGGIAPNHELAEKWMRQAVDLNSAEGQYQFGNLLYNEMDKEGHQDNSRFTDAAEWFRKGAEQGYAKAQYQLADMYNTGKLGNEQRSNCIPWFLKAAAQGNAEAQAEVGELPVLYPNNELLKSVNNIEILRQSGEQGNLEAQFQLAKRYQTGIGVPKDAVEAFKWMQKAAQNDKQSSLIGDAIYCLAVMYEKGEGVTQDLAQAHNLFIEAAGPTFRQANAAFRVGQMYENGDGVPQNDHTAMKFYCNNVHDPEHPEYAVGYHPGNGAIESVLNLWAQGRGFPDEKDRVENDYRKPDNLIQSWNNWIVTAQTEFCVGQIYYQGKLVPQDMVEAAARFQIAADQNFDEARKELDEVTSKLSGSQKEAAQNRKKVLKENLEQARRIQAAQKQGLNFMPWGYPRY